MLIRYTYIAHLASNPTFHSEVITRKQKKQNAQWAEPVLLTFHSVLRKLYTEPSTGVSYQISVHLTNRFRIRFFFRNQPIRNKKCLWWPCLLTDWDKMSNL